MGERLPVEKLYLQTDKPYYSSGDTIRFKAYLLDADFLLPSARSGLLYVELDDMAGTAIKRVMVPVNSGLSWGDITLNEKEVHEGSFVLRAYTNWMRNFGEGYVFKKNIYVSATSGPTTLVRAIFRTDSAAGKNKVEANLQLTSTGNIPVALKDMKLLVTDGKHTLARDKVTTGIDGSLKFGFGLADKTALKNLTIKAQQTGNGADTATLAIPVNINRPEKTDLQFMPEGGNLVAGISTKVGFKAVSEDGKGMALAGKIYNGKGQEITSFKTAHAGMGSFGLAPQAGESYYAKITLPKGITKEYPLPLASLSGTSLSVKPLGNDTLVLTVNATADLTNKPITYCLIGQSRGVVCYAQALGFGNNLPVKAALPSSLFPTGIARFTLLDQGHLPLNERQVFINHHDELQISVSTDKQNYKTRDSIALAIEVKDKDGRPVQGSFSLAVTDDSQVKIDSSGSNILNNLLLTSDLKGNIEAPGYYFTGDKAEELDNLMLTQGWVGYSWKEVFNPVKTPIAYPAEKEFVVQGKVTNAFNKPVVASKVILISNNPPIFKDTVTNTEGRFYFKGLVPVDTALFKIQARTKKGSSFNVNINGEEFKPPVFGPSAPISPWYVNPDTIVVANVNTKAAQLKAVDDLMGKGLRLKEVTIKAKKIIPGSKNLNGPGEYDEAFDEKDFKNANKMTLGDFLEKNIRGYVVNGIWGKDRWYYVLKGKRIHFIIDGMDLEYGYSFGSSGGESYEDERYHFIKNYLGYFTAEDITGIEVMYNTGHIGSYGVQYAPIGKSPNGDEHAYLEITTRAKKGPFMRVTPGTYLYKTLPFALYKEFYRPKYNANNRNIAIGTDLRSTIHWAPNVTTDAEGKARLSFYSADKPSIYTVTVEGTDLQGQIGYRKQKINAATPPSSHK
ncbi:hypothetical protein [uncultured Mucilaginibacter sp.]|uniref:carboxypeptidase-like regulatory domain-containing protein n=1 Tax=uncultured Mucilaginibacter sp. TaxID=797541 RepID=UPI002638D437|nr:hypothetical protein [uncultured Mucilaginibacter sp.]